MFTGLLANALKKISCDNSCKDMIFSSNTNFNRKYLNKIKYYDWGLFRLSVYSQVLQYKVMHFKSIIYTLIKVFYVL